MYLNFTDISNTLERKNLHQHTLSTKMQGNTNVSFRAYIVRIIIILGYLQLYPGDHNYNGGLYVDSLDSFRVNA